jgi:CBS domain-containing protein
MKGSVLPVIGEDRLVGTITETDLLRAFVRLTDQLAAPVAIA